MQQFKLTQKIRGLQCIGVIVKDNYDTKDLQTTGGSLAMKWFIPATDAFMVQRIRSAGAIILGKSNMAEWAFSPYETVSSIAGHHAQSLQLGLSCLPDRAAERPLPLQQTSAP